MAFSWVKFIEATKRNKVRRARTLAGGASPESMANPDMKLAHPDWVRDANNKNFVSMDKLVKEKLDMYFKRQMDRRKKIA